MIVVDASVVIKWVVAEAGHDIALELVMSPNDLVAPSILVAELVNVLRKKVYRKEISAEQAGDGTKKVVGSISQFIDINRMSTELMDMTIALNHPAYDCCYILVAKHTNAALVTADVALERKALECGVKAFGLAAWAQAGR